MRCRRLPWVDPEGLEETLLFIEEARATLGAALPARFSFAAGDSLERRGQVGEALRLCEGLLSHPEVPVDRRAAARRARVAGPVLGATIVERPLLASVEA